ncbi:MAG: hypothetical protein R3210_08840, partial [Roseovarius sp.]|nr:hypothetical protein [Roseovarius sp.]
RRAARAGGSMPVQGGGAGVCGVSAAGDAPDLPPGGPAHARRTAAMSAALSGRDKKQTGTGQAVMCHPPPR